MNNSSLTEEIWNLINKRWNLRILKILDTKNIIRFNELKQSTRGISANVLSNRLVELEKFGLIKRISTSDTPTHIGYLLTERCENLKNILIELENWIHSYQSDQSKTSSLNNSILSEKIFNFLKKEISETELNYIKDKLLFSLGNESHDLFKNFNALKNIIFELYGEEIGNKIIEKLNKQIESYKIDV